MIYKITFCASNYFNSLIDIPIVCNILEFKSNLNFNSKYLSFCNYPNPSENNSTYS